MTNALQYHYFPFFRQGMAAGITSDAVGPRAVTTATVSAKGYLGTVASPSSSVTKTIALYGPADLTGFDAKIVARTNPRPHVGDFEPNIFPHVDFVSPDYPWRFTPGVPQKEHQLLPWISLIVLRVDPSEDESSEVLEEGQLDSSDGELREILEEGHSPERRTPWVTVHPNALPNFHEAWRWAHVQFTANPEAPLDFTSPQKVRAVLENEPERSVARLVCARRLRPKARYRALVVPTFEIGRQAGLEVLTDPGLSGMTPILTGSDPITLPYYFQWEFGTGSRGDFEYLVRRLEARWLPNLGRRPMRVAQPGYGLPGVGETPDLESSAHVLEMEGALESVEAPYAELGQDSLILDLQIIKDAKNWKQFSLKTQRPTKVRISYGKSPTHYGTSKVSSSFETHHSIRIYWLEHTPFYFRVTWHDEEEQTGEYHGQFPHTFVKPGNVFQNKLSDLLNAVGTAGASGDGVPLVGPPIYGQWHAQRNTVDPQKSRWLDTLNLDPRHRVAAGMGSQVIRDHQEPLMAAAWEQAGEIEEANQLIRQAQLACELSLSAYNRVKKAFYNRGKKAFNDEGMTAEILQWAAPTFQRIRAMPVEEEQTKANQNGTFTQQLTNSHPLLPRVLDTAFVQMLRARGPIRKRQQPTQTGSSSGNKRALPELYKNRFYAVAPSHSSKELIGFIKIGQPPVTAKSRIGRPGAGAIASVAPQRTPSQRITPETRKAKLGKGVLPDSTKIWMQATTRFPSVSLTPTPEVVLPTVGKWVFEQLNPVTVIPQQMARRFQVEGPPRVHPLDVVLAAPSFSEPMYEPLMEIDQNWILPGVENVPQNTLALLKPNRRFIEAYLCGLNHEWMRELGWREYPTDQRGSSFRQFWDVNDAIPTGKEKLLPVLQQQYVAQQLGKMLQQLEEEEKWEERLKDILPLSEWKQKGLGDHANIWGSPKNQPDQLVLLIRGDLIKKYPNTVIYAVEAQIVDKKRRPALPEFIKSIKEASPIFPIFSAHLPEDMLFFGFPFSEKAARSKNKGQGYFFVLEERVSETRFGLDLSNDSKPKDLTTTWKDLTWSHFTGKTQDDYLNDEPPTDPVSQRRPFNPVKNPEIDDKSWNKSSAAIAAITLQGPFRVAIHASQMLSKST